MRGQIEVRSPGIKPNFFFSKPAGAHLASQKRSTSTFGAQHCFTAPTTTPGSFSVISPSVAHSRDAFLALVLARDYAVLRDQSVRYAKQPRILDDTVPGHGDDEVQKL